MHQVLVTGFNSVSKAHLRHELEVSASRFRSVVDSAYDAIVTIDERHNITLFNRAAENLFGYQAEKVLGRPIETLLPERSRANHPRKRCGIAGHRRRSRASDSGQAAAALRATGFRTRVACKGDSVHRQHRCGHAASGCARCRRADETRGPCTLSSQGVRSKSCRGRVVVGSQAVASLSDFEARDLMRTNAGFASKQRSSQVSAS